MGGRTQKKAKRAVNARDENAYIKIAIAAIIFIISVVLISKSNKVVEKILVSYNTDSSIDYNVSIIPNEFIKEPTMEKGRTYVTALVDNIEANINFVMTSSKKFTSYYKYNIVAVAKVNQNSNGKELWTEEFELASNEDLQLEDSKKIAVSEKIQIPFSVINFKVKAFKSQYNIDIDSFVDVNLNVIDKATNRVIGTTGLSMPLVKETFDVREVSTGKDVQNVTQTETPNAFMSKIEFLVAVVSIIYIAYKVYEVININNVNKSYYTRAIYKILKNYGDIVAEIIKPVDLSNLKVIDVKNFDQLLDVEEELRIPIMFYETIKNEEGVFVLVHNDMAYRYILRDRLKY